MYPILFEIGPVTIHTLWVFTGFGIIAFAYYFGALSKRVRLSYDWVLKKTLPILLSTILVSRIIFVLFNFESWLYATDFFRVFALWDQGFSFVGALLGLLLPFLYFAKKRNEPIFHWLDVIVVAVFMGLFFVNIGAFFDGRHYGYPSSLPWSMHFENPIIPYAVPIHPTQLYAAIFSFITFLVLMSLFKKYALRRPGFIFKVALILGGGFRFVEEFFRGDETLMLFHSGIRVPHILALLTFVGGIILIFIKIPSEVRGEIHQMPKGNSYCP